MRFYGVNVTYSLQTPNVSCYAVEIAQGPEDQYGTLYVNDSAVLQRPDCKEIQYAVLAKEEQSRKEALTHVTIVLDGSRKLSLGFGLGGDMSSEYAKPPILEYAKYLVIQAF